MSEHIESCVINDYNTLFGAQEVDDSGDSTVQSELTDIGIIVAFRINSSQ